MSAQILPCASRQSGCVATSPIPSSSVRISPSEGRLEDDNLVVAELESKEEEAGKKTAAAEEEVSILGEEVEGVAT